MNKSSLPKLGKAKIEKILAGRKLEDPKRTKEVEDFLKRKRGYVFRMPKPGSLVISLFSGGLDTTIVSAMLIEEFGLTVYPLFIDNVHAYSKYEQEAAEYFASYFARRYGKRFGPLKKIVANYPFRPEEVDYGQPPKKKNFFYSSLQCIYATQYAYSLEKDEGTKARCVVTSFMRSDGDYRVDQTFSAIRKVMLHICLMTEDFNWQITALPLEKELGFFHDKHHFVAWASAKRIPLEETRSSCLQEHRLNCGDCVVCWVRKNAFTDAGVIDRTRYFNVKNTLVSRAIRKAKRLIKISSAGEHE